MAQATVRKTLKILISWMVVVLISFASLEFLMIVLEPYLFKGFYQYDADMGFRVRPHTRGSNRFGFNDRDYPLHRTPGTYRILVVGDSFSWAGGIDGNYTALLERIFTEHYGDDRVEVINGGYPMTHTAEQLSMLRKYGLQYDPNLVLLGFFVGNDFFDADPYRKRIVVNDVYFDIDKRREHTLFGYPLVARSRLFSFVQQKYTVWRESVRARRKAETPDDRQGEDPKGTFSEQTFLNIERSRLEFFNRAAHDQGAFADKVDFALSAITEMKRLLDSRGIDFRVGLYPDEFQVNQTLLNKLFEKYELRRSDFELELAQIILKKHLDALSIPYIELLDEFKRHDGKNELYLLRDTHWNKAGNQLAAEVLFRYLMPIVDQTEQESIGDSTEGATRQAQVRKGGHNQWVRKAVAVATTTAQHRARIVP